MSTDAPTRDLIVGRPVLIVIDIQGGAPGLVATARECGVPIVFFQEAHRRDLVDVGRELDDAAGAHLLEGDLARGLDAHEAALRATEYLEAGACCGLDEVVAAFENFATRSLVET